MYTFTLAIEVMINIFSGSLNVIRLNNMHYNSWTPTKYRIFIKFFLMSFDRIKEKMFTFIFFYFFRSWFYRQWYCHTERSFINR